MSGRKKFPSTKRSKIRDSNIFWKTHRRYPSLMFLEEKSLTPKHHGYRRQKSFQMAQLVYDLTIRFCDRYIDRRSRTHDQMVQAARSGVQNIAEGSQASGTSRKTELKLTNVGQASLEELRLDYEDFLRQWGLSIWEPAHPALARFKTKHCSSVEHVGAWVQEERALHGVTENQGQSPTGRDPARSGASSMLVDGRPCQFVPSPVLVAKAVLSLPNLCCHFLNRQIAAQAEAFENEGGLTERLYRVRSVRRNGLG